ncbi:MAG TPA: 4Fe-4S dicluster domain-containing protein [Anaerohalosphaeraceae bacterium]|nr:4Fe-4S dicluster domain-containing protein [Phycisphaerae bacterium]HOL32602.1 4Fe-4S dicluster domain-containing protein [Anaerohalosphaeraceae bacterium]HOM76114.1 4Fe-4S dicluster domain-containing protein [Anaerohalosphaeraceae bacterium]HPC63343.1 4Fe-4S dicluster domain-containing protein [Anaerohalosphaeraceae bacterium]HPO69080.1 4Fe-4S dicluster domain-containing protein [Anaerohalosphaeraceae bacterium]
MSVSTVTKEQFKSFVAGLIGSEQMVIGVQAKQDKFAFGPLLRAEDLRLDYDVTILSPRKYLLPPREVLLNYQVCGEAQSIWDCRPMILIGVHPYDMIAINQMDELFRQGQYDAHYMNRRNNITIIACDVATPSMNVFASSMDTATVESGFDILLTDIGSGYVVQADTDKGQALVKKMAGIKPATAEDLAKRQAIQDKNRKTLNKHPLECKPSFIPKLLEKAYDHPIWEEKARLCYSCGSCNQVCPTCYCFDVQDEVNWDLKTGIRYRAWDGCLLENFATVAGNHNFRKDRSARFRHRLYRKGKYVPAKIGGQIACVGCGRCITACTAKIANPVEVYNTLLEKTDIG